MTPQEEQAMLASRMLFSGLDAADNALKRLDDPLIQSMLQIKQLILGLPQEALLRESAWRKLRPQVLQILEPWSASVNQAVIDAITNNIDAQAGLAARYLAATPEAKYVEPELLRFRDTATERTVPVSTLGARGVEQAAETFIQRAPNNVADIVAQVRVNEQSLKRIFGSSASASGVRPSGFARFAYNSIDRRVRQGILEGTPTEEIAELIFRDRTGTRFALTEAERRMMRDAEAIARTAVADSNRIVHEQIWDANDDVIKAYEFDATLDSRVCPSCSELDGLRATNRDELPTTPIHPRCRCARRPLTEFRLQREADEKQKGATKLIPESQFPKQRKGESRAAYVKRLKSDPSGSYYLTKVKVNGESFYRQAVQVDLPAGGGRKRRPSQTINFLASDKANALTRQEAFGGGLPGQKRANFFMKEVRRGVDPEVAYQKLLKGKRGERSFIPAAKIK